MRKSCYNSSTGKINKGDAVVSLYKYVQSSLSWQSAGKNNGIDKFSCTLFCPIGQNELDINECDAQIPHIVKNLRSPNEVRGNNRLTAVIEDTLIIIKAHIWRLYYEYGSEISVSILEA